MLRTGSIWIRRLSLRHPRSTTMTRLAQLFAVILLAGVALLAGCPADEGQSGDTQSAMAGDPHAGHDHGAGEHMEDVPAHEEEEDGHAGHDHAEGEAELEHDEHAEDDHADHGDEVHSAETEDEHAGHDHEAEAEAGGISLSAEQARELGIKSAPAGAGSLGRELTLNGEVAINEDAVTHVAPRISGIIRKVHRTLGDYVVAGQALLELDSIELAAVKSEYLAALSRIELARQTLEREEMLLEKGISAEQDYLEASQAYDAELISRRAIEQQLRAMGLSTDQIAAIPENPDGDMTAYTVHAPVSGEIIEKHAALGELVNSESEVFTIGDLSTVWVRLNVYQQDFVDVEEGMEVLVDPGHGM
ncbi:MAG TPA: HlyD family efflux transporter periplasmic adaptor subunit, partial [Firmicutes bacterium]|nr:HlyD family efflux transporter periplasmic adaptor subunit [Bacillota bacterium]